LDRKACLQKKGKLIMAAFSVGRTQEILYFLNQLDWKTACHTWIIL
jgi:Cft2 family RNA processing exonuclease